MNTPRYSAVLKNRGFLFLWMGQLLSQLADRIFIYVLMIVAFSLTRTSLGVSVPMLSFGLASVLFGMIAGVFVDRHSRKSIMIISDVLRGAMILCLIPFANNSLVLIFVVSFLIYTVTQFFAPAETASIPELIEKQDLIVANSLFMVTWMASAVIGLGLGAPLTNYFGETNTFIVAAGLYFVSSLLILMVPLKHNIRDINEKYSSIVEELSMGIEFIRRNAVVKYALFKMFVATSALAVVSMLAITYSKDVLMIGAKNFGYLVIFSGVGMFFGMGIIGRISHIFKKGTIVITGFLMSGLLLVLFSAVKDIYLVFFFAFLLGVGNTVITVSIQTMLQEKIPKQIRGRIFGVQNMLINSAFTFPLVIFGVIADIVGIKPAFVILGLILALTGLAGIFMPKFREA